MRSKINRREMRIQRGVRRSIKLLGFNREEIKYIYRLADALINRCNKDGLIYRSKNIHIYLKTEDEVYEIEFIFYLDMWFVKPRRTYNVIELKKIIKCFNENKEVEYEELKLSNIESNDIDVLNKLGHDISITFYI